MIGLRLAFTITLLLGGLFSPVADRERATVLGVCEAVGRAESAATSNESEGPTRLRLEEVEYGMAP
jgi:hypothetical protein